MSAEAVLTTLVTSAILSAVPLMLAAVGESIGEQSGVLNLGIEGTMALSGFAAFWTALRSGDATIGLVSGAGVGLVLGFVFGALATYGRADQVVLGLAVTLGGTGASGFLFREAYGSDQPLLTGGPGRPFAGLGDPFPVVGPAIANQRWFVYAAWVVVALLVVWFGRARVALRIRAAGEAPRALEAAGGNVARTRLGASMLAGLLTGLGGASLVVVEVGFFSPGVTAGSGFLAIALAMIGGLQPGRVALVTLAFGALAGLDTGLQVAGIGAPAELLRMIPYAGVLVALLVLGRGRVLPSALGRAYPAEGH